MKKIFSIIGIIFLLILGAGNALATKPAPIHKVVICHAIPPDTAANGYIRINVDIASSGHLRGGHDTQHDADIIPPYVYLDFSYPGKNWDGEGQAIWNNDCVVPSETSSPTPTSSPTSSEQVSPTPSGQVSPSPSSEVPTASPTPIGSGTLSSEVPPNVNITPPPTDTVPSAQPSKGNIFPVVLAISLIALFALLLSPRSYGFRNK